MKTNQKNVRHFLVLVPHRDARIEMQKRSEELVKNGLSNAYPFPHAAVLASLTEPLDAGELKQIARVLRESAGKEKFNINETALIFMENEEIKLFGYNINPDISLNISGGNIRKIKNIFSPAAVGSFFIRAQAEDSNFFDSYLKNSIQINFNAAAAANMSWKLIKVNGEILYKWRIGKLYWLPKPAKN